MDSFRETMLALVAMPIYIIFIGLEIVLSYFHDKKFYSLKDTVANVYLSALNFLLDLLLRSLGLLVLVYFYDQRFFEIRNSFIYWIVLLFTEDFMYYWLHRVDHFCRFFWAVHVTHHSSENFNLTVGFRSSVFQPLYRFIYFIPLALMGFKPVDIAFMYAATQIYGILIHTRYVNKMGFLEWFMATPSHHRVHHGSNVQYLDRNMGMVFIIWDKLFGTFEPEKEEVKYGLTENLKTNNPIKVVFHEWQAMLKDLKRSSLIKDKFMYIFGPPGWSHDGHKKTSGQLRAEMETETKGRIIPNL
jgi:sterol desaturase/sphingolipid hydroxylase (fatty acid hydroxylase superfamily)